jgi:hypothetical protein
VGRSTKKRGGNISNSSKGFNEVTMQKTSGNTENKPAKNRNKNNNTFPARDLVYRLYWELLLKDITIPCHSLSQQIQKVAN